MKRFLSAALALLLALSLCACGESGGDTTPTYPAGFTDMAELIDAARDEGRLTVLTSAENDYLTAACETFETLFDIPVTLRTADSGASPSGDVWFGSGADCRALSDAGAVADYTPAAAAGLTAAGRRSDGSYVVTADALGLMSNADVLRRMGISAPKTWDDLLDPVYRELLWVPDYSTETGRLFLRTVMAQYGDGAVDYLTRLDTNVQFYVAADDTAAGCLATGECVVGIGWLSTALAAQRADDNGDIRLAAMESAAPGRAQVTAVLTNALHPAAAQLWQEFILSARWAEQATDLGFHRLTTVAEIAAEEALPALTPSLLTETDPEDEETSAAVDETLAAVLTALTESGVNVEDPSRWNVA